MTQNLNWPESESEVWVTANQRMAIYLQEQFAKSNSRAVWVAPSIFAWHHWLDELMAGLAGQGFLKQRRLSSTQAQIIWQSVLEQDPIPDGPDSDTLSDMASEAYQLIGEWQVSLDDPELDTTEEGRHLIRWSRAFERECEQRNLNFATQNLSTIVRAIESGWRFPFDKITLYGFDALSPAMLGFFESLKSCGCDIQEYSPESQNKRVNTASFSDSESELRAAFSEASAHLALHPDARIGIVVPNLHQNRQRIADIAKSVLAPAVFTQWLPDAELPFNISAGEPMLATPLIREALLGLTNLKPNLTLETLEAYSKARYLRGGHSESLARSQINHELRKKNWQQCSLVHFMTFLTQQGDVPELVQTLTIASDRRFSTGKRLPSQWITLWAKKLSALGWPGERPLDSVEYQLWQLWTRTAEQFAALDSVVDACSYTTAFHWLRKCIQQQSFQIEQPRTPITIMGLLEASGLQYDMLWLTGMDDRVWPATPKPNPMIPIAIQHARDFPRSNPARELSFAKQLTNRLIGSAKQCVFSFSRHDGDLTLRPSPLISNFPTYPMAIETKRDHEAKTLTHVFDAPVPLAQKAFKGGARALSLQALCPIRAFAEVRLGAIAAPVHTLGAQAMQRGIWIHAVLEAFYQSITIIEDLAQWDKAFWKNWITQFLKKEAQGLSDVFIALETERLLSLLDQLIEHERRRSPFEIVAIELPVTLNIEGIEMRLRIDRVDKLSDGRLLVIDYKSGASRLLDATEPPLLNVQLPLYAQTDPRISAVALYRVKNQSVGLQGIGESPEGLPGVIPVKKLGFENFNELRTHWREQLASLMREFKSGAANVRPHSPERACQRCHLPGFCRIGSVADG